MDDYKQLLLDDRWQDHRLKIIKKDNWLCNHCQNQSYIKNHSCGSVINASILKQSLHTFSEQRTIKSLYEINLQFGELQYISFITTFIVGLTQDLTDSEVYFDPHGIKANIQAIKSVKGWILVKNLHVHHTYYQETKDPWEYPDESLVTLCWECHLNLHAISTIPWLDKYGNKKGYLTSCSRCGGAGILQEYKHVQGGICFKCNGNRYVQLIQ